MIRSENEHDVLSVNELRAVIGSLLEAEWIKLGKTADYLCWGLAIEGKDLLNTAFCKALEGKRKCPRNVAALVFIRGVMQSLVSASLKRRKRDPLAQSVEMVVEDDLLEGLDLNPNIDSPEAILIASQTLKKIDQILSGDQIMEMVFMAQVDGYSPQEIQNLAGISAVQYASTLRNIRRKLNKMDKEESTA